MRHERAGEGEACPRSGLTCGSDFAGASGLKGTQRDRSAGRAGQGRLPGTANLTTGSSVMVLSSSDTACAPGGPAGLRPFQPRALQLSGLSARDGSVGFPTSSVSASGQEGLGRSLLLPASRVERLAQDSRLLVCFSGLNAPFLTFAPPVGSCGRCLLLPARSCAGAG